MTKKTKDYTKKQVKEDKKQSDSSYNTYYMKEPKVGDFLNNYVKTMKPEQIAYVEKARKLSPIIISILTFLWLLYVNVSFFIALIIGGILYFIVSVYVKGGNPYGVQKSKTSSSSTSSNTESSPAS